MLNQGGLFGGSVPVGAPNDYREQEADRIADLVVPRTGPGQGAVPAARRGDTEWSPARTARAPGDLEQFQGMNGHALEPAARNYFEPRFGYDFSRVRVFEDGAAFPDIGTGQVICNDEEQNPEITSPVIPFATAGWVSDRIHAPNPY